MMFRCPHCKQRTIGVWAKLKANGFRPSRCPQCDGKFVPAVWGTLPSLIAFAAAFVAPFIIAGAVTQTVAWMLLAAAIVLGSAAATLVYLPVTPLLRHGSRAARWDWWSWVGVIAVVAVWAAVAPSSQVDRTPVTHSGERKPLFGIRSGAPPRERSTRAVHYSDPLMQEELKAALEKGGIAFGVEMQDGKEYVRWDAAHHAAVQEIERELRGGAISTGSNVHFPDQALREEFKKWLADNGIKHRTIIFRGEETVVWDGKEDLVRKFMAQRPSDCPKAAAPATSKNC
jgi:hypothetical protein